MGERSLMDKHVWHIFLSHYLKKYMRAIWTGSLGFGLVNIPIKIFSAVQDSTLDLDMLDSKDHSNIKFKRVNEKTGKKFHGKILFGDIILMTGMWYLINLISKK
jgi:hypothetical protein